MRAGTSETLRTAKQLPRYTAHGVPVVAIVVVATHQTATGFIVEVVTIVLIVRRRGPEVAVIANIVDTTIVEVARSDRRERSGVCALFFKDTTEGHKP